MIRTYYYKNLFEKIRTDVKIRIFLIPIAYWSGFRIFKENQENPAEIGKVGQSDIVLQRPYRSKKAFNCYFENRIIEI